MAFLFAAIASVAFGFAAGQLTLIARERVAQYRQRVQLRVLTGESRRKVPLRVFVENLEGWQTKFLQNGLFRKYFDFLSGLIQRSQKTELNPGQILAYQLVAAILAALLFGLLTQTAWAVLGAVLLGFATPVLWLRDNALRREKNLLKELPNALEVMSLCVEAGLSLEQGLTQYLRNSKPQPLTDEFQKVLEQTRVGSSRKDALQSMSLRLNLTDISLFVTSVVHAERFGTGMAKTLRQLAATLRDKQVQRAEKSLQELPVKMLLPLLLFIMPVTFLIIFGPILLDFFH